MKNNFEGKEVLLSMESSHALMRTMGVITPGNFFNLIDGFTSLGTDLLTSILPASKEKAFKDATKLSTRTRRKLHDLTIIDLSRIRFLTPERLTGNMMTVLDDLITANGVVVDNLTSSIKDLSNDVSLFLNTGINDAKSPTSYSTAMKLRKSREICMASIASNFKATKVTSYGVLGEHFRTPEQVSRFLVNLNSLESVVNSKRWDSLIGRAQDLNEQMLEVLEYIKTLEEEEYRSRPVKELNEAFFEVAKSYEFVGYIQAKTLQVFQSTKSICEAIMIYQPQPPQE